jgi:hypothetical protein
MTRSLQADETTSQQSNPQDLLQYATALDSLPPWSEADAKERCRTVFIYVAVYFPVFFVVSIALSVFAVTVALYIYPLVGSQDDTPELWYWHSSSEHSNARVRGWVIFGLMCWFEFWVFVSLYRAITTSPGTIPDANEWFLHDEALEEQEDRTLERRQDGNLRFCVTCSKVKPDRCHHCRLCDVCVLKMDHHCPWIANCVGYRNYKYFFLLVSYGAAGLLLFTCTFWETVVVVLNNDESSSGLCLLVVLSYSLGSMLAVVLSCFWLFHVYLVSNSMTTIEFCEKRKKWTEQQGSPYTQSLYNNWQEALGSNPLLWCFPCCKS